MSSEKMIECEECGRVFDNKQAIGAHKQGGHNQKWRDKELLKNLYVKKGLELKVIASKLGCSDTTAKRWIDEYNLTRKYEDKNWLRDKYLIEELKISQIAELCNVSDTVIVKRLEEFGIETRGTHDYKDRPWTDRNTFEELYVKKSLSLREMAKELNCHISTINDWRNIHGFEKRGWEPGQRVEYAHFYTNKNGYEQSMTAVGDTTKQYFIHRLVAIAEYGVDAVKDMVVHHKNGIPWDNRKENLSIMTRSEHSREHYNRGDAFADS